jgi:hypothetical protein
MQNAITSRPSTAVDGLESFVDDEAGPEDRASASTIRGARLKFTNEAKWVTQEGLELDESVELVVIDVQRFVVRWGAEAPEETITVPPGKQYPDIKLLNEQAPREQWRKAPNGELAGPWQAQRVAYLFDLRTLDKFSWPTATIGGRICIAELSDKTKLMRRFRGSTVYPVIGLSAKHMHTAYGGRQRPHFLIRRWIMFGPDGGVAALPAPVGTQEQLEQFAGNPEPAPASKPTPPTKPAPTPRPTPPPPAAEAALGARTVTPPTLAEEMGDDIPF